MAKSIMQFSLWVAVVAAVLAPALAAPAAASQLVAYASSAGHDSNPCTAAQPCASLTAAAATLLSGGEVDCIDPPASGIVVNAFPASSEITIDCPGFVWLAETNSALSLISTNVTVKFRHLTFNLTAANGNVGILIGGSGNFVFEDCVIENNVGSNAIEVAPNGPLNLVIANTRIVNNGTGVLIAPGSGGSVTAAFDHVTISQNAGAGILIDPGSSASVNATLERVTIAQNTGGGIKIETANGPVTMDITDSVVSNNGGSGINAVAGGSQNIVNIKNSIFAKNGAAGAQANGANAGVLVANTLFDQNVAGATSVVNGGNMFTYGNNQIVGPTGSGFNATAQLH